MSRLGLEERSEAGRHEGRVKVCREQDRLEGTDDGEERFDAGEEEEVGRREGVEGRARSGRRSGGAVARRGRQDGLRVLTRYPGPRSGSRGLAVCPAAMCGRGLDWIAGEGDEEKRAHLDMADGAEIGGNRY